MNSHAEEAVVANLQEQSHRWSLAQEAPMPGMCAWHAEAKAHPIRLPVPLQLSRLRESLTRRGSTSVRERTPLKKAIATPECSFPQPAAAKHSMRLITKYGVQITTFDKYLAGTLQVKHTQRRSSTRAVVPQPIRWKPFRLSRALEKQLFPDLVDSIEAPRTRQKK